MPAPSRPRSAAAGAMCGCSPGVEAARAGDASDVVASRPSARPVPRVNTATCAAWSVAAAAAPAPADIATGATAATAAARGLQGPHRMNPSIYQLQPCVRRKLLSGLYYALSQFRKRYLNKLLWNAHIKSETNFEKQTCDYLHTPQS